MNKPIAIIACMLMTLGGSSTVQARGNTYTPAKTFVLMDFEDSVIHDKTWLLSQPKGTTNIFVQDSSKSRTANLSLAVGKGRNGSNALLVKTPKSSNKLPKFSVLKALNAGYPKDIKTEEGYLLPRNIKANRLEFWIRFEKGFRANKNFTFPLKHPNHENLRVTTSHFDPSKIDGDTKVVESNGFLFTHSIFLRHDIAGEDWIHVVINQQPQAKISYNFELPNNPTKPVGNYYELLTHVNIDLNTYFSDSTSSVPVKMWVDDITLSYIPENTDFTIDFLNYSQGQTVDVLRDKERMFPIKLTNNETNKVCGTLSSNTPWWLAAEILDNGQTSSDSICLNGQSSKTFNLVIKPKSSLSIGKEAYAGLTFVNENNIQTDSESVNRSLSDDNVEKRSRSKTGPHDSNVSSDFIKLKLASTLASTDNNTESDRDTNTETDNNTETDTNTETDNNTGNNTGSSSGSGSGSGTNSGYLKTANVFMLMDFEDSAIHDKPWFLSQPKGEVAFFVQPKGDSGADKLSLAVGAGRNGGNALLVESTGSKMGLPGFWVIKAENQGNAGRPKDKRGYFLPENLKANRLEFWLRFENGFRSNKAASLPAKWPNHQNLHVGTYQFDPAKIDGVTGVVESDNWHFYHQVFLRHDKAGSGWIHVVVNQQPQHQRGISSSLPNNPTMPAGNYFELLTRLYVDLHPYFSDPEKPYPVKMWVDDIALSYVPENPDLNIKFLGHSLGNTVGVSKGAKSSFPVTITNNQSVEVCGILSTNTPYWFNPVLTDSSGVQLKNSTLCFAAKSSQNFTFSVVPKSTRSKGEISSASLTFVNENTVLSDSISTNRSSTDGNVEKRWYPETGSHDVNVSSEFIKIKIQ